MRFTLKDYQVDAVGDALRNLRRARRDFHESRDPSAFSLTATTGAGKTVMAAAVIEALFDGNDDFDFESDEGAVVLWFSDTPSLNEQTRFRLIEAADRLAHSRLVVVENTFNQERFEAGKVYFLNSQKLRANATLVRGANESTGELYEPSSNPDLRAFTIWDTIRNTIEDPRLTLYMILDEAHRGMKSTTSSESEKQTIVRRLINGANGVPPVPIVWGISATVDRFNKAMSAAEGRATYPAVHVDPNRVQESGLLKDDIRLEIPAEAGKFDLVLLSRATRKVRESTSLWKAYAESQEATADVVTPLMVVQVPNTPDDQLLLSAFTTIRDAWPDLPPESMAHVFSDHAPLEIGPYLVPHISPERVQETSRIRVLFAKDAISTGWDCPRAEVLVSFRAAVDETHITQLLGRMVRTPLARRIPGNDRLNAVECVLPFFDRKTATAVAEVLLGKRAEGEDGRGDSGGGTGRRVLIDPQDMDVNEAIPASVWDAFDRLPSETLPKKAARPTKRLTALAQALSRDGLRENARRDAYAEMFAVLDGLMARHSSRVEQAMYGILEVTGETLVAGLKSKTLSVAPRFSEVADDRAVEANFRAAGRVFSPDIARQYADHIAIADNDDDGLFDAHLKVAALARVEGVQEEVDRAANELAKRWFSEYRVDIKALADERRAVYNELLAQSTEPQATTITRPRVRAEETRTADGTQLPTRPGHLMSDAAGNFPVGGLNTWEIRVVDEEVERSGFAAWYRNPGRGSDDSLAIAYQDGKAHWRRVCPDFIFFSQSSDGQVRASIVDPHGHHLADALPKLRGLARFAATNAESFHRIESVAQMKNGTLRVLDLTASSVREAIQTANDAERLYLSAAADDY